MSAQLAQMPALPTGPDAPGDAARPPRVAALMPTWNAASFIAPTLESLAAQTYGNLEVLISDDRSTDDTAHICEQFVAGRPHFRLVRQPTRLGWIGNANWLLRQARAAASGPIV